MTRYRIAPLLPLLAPLVLAACAATAPVAVFVPPKGSLVRVQQDIVLPAGARSYIQGGRLMARSGVNVLDPYCHFTVDRLALADDAPFTLRPGSFEVTSAERLRDHASAAPQKYAGRAGSDRTLSTVMALSSGAQPEVKRLTCSRWGQISESGWLTIAEMQATLGGLASIELTPSAGG